MRTTNDSGRGGQDSGLIEEITRGGFGLTHGVLMASIRVAESAAAMRSRLVARTVDLVESFAHETADLVRGMNDRQSELERLLFDTSERVGVTLLERAGGTAVALASTVSPRTRLPLTDARAEMPQA